MASSGCRMSEGIAQTLLVAAPGGHLYLTSGMEPAADEAVQEALLAACATLSGVTLAEPE